MAEKENLEQIEQSIQTVNNNQESELWKVLGPDYPKIWLSVPDEDSPKIRTYEINNSYFAEKWTCRSERSRTYSIQDLVTIETSSYCSPDGRNYRYSIDKINLFPSEDDLPEEYDNTVSNRYGSGQYDYLSYDDENMRIFHYSTWDELSSQEHYFWVSLDSTVLFPWIETVQECNGWYFHHIKIDNKSDYKAVDERSIQETINAFMDQKREGEKLEEYRERNWDIWIELPWTEYSTWWYEPSAYMWDKHWTPVHEHSGERWCTNKILVKFWKPWDDIKFFWGWSRYSINVGDDRKVDINIHTNHSWNNNQNRWFEEMKDSSIQPWQIFINGMDVYQDTIQRIKTKELERKENLKWKFNGLKETLINTYSFSESEFKDLCKYAWKWNVIKFLSTVKSMLEESDIQKDDIMSVMTEIKYTDNMVFQNYVLIKRKARNFNQNEVKRVLEKGYARTYLKDKLPWIWFVWYFDDAMEALKLAFQNWLFRKDNFAYATELEPTISDLWQALMDAGIVPKIDG